MPLRLSPLALVLVPLLGQGLVSFSVLADAVPLEIIEVTGHNPGNLASVAPESTSPRVDISALLNQLPGAAVNGNGPLTGIAQYRGLFGDRVSTKVNGLSLAGAGPNAMDSPLSYASLVLTERLELSRGIAPVSAGIDTLGGSIAVIESQARLDETSAMLAGQYQDNGGRSHMGAKANVARGQHAMLLYGDLLKGRDNTRTGDNRDISPGVYDKAVFGGQYRYSLDNSRIEDDAVAIGYQYLETRDAGTPALPMDIDYIRSDRLKLEALHSLGNWQLDWQLAYSDARHGMDNFSLRTKMPAMASRYNTADSQSHSAAVELGNGSWLFGAELQQGVHDSLITDPGNPMLQVDNFNGVEDDSYSAFGQWQGDIGRWNWQLGARIKHYRSDSNSVSHSMASAMPAIRMLMDRYNNADRAQSQTGVDLAINGRYQLSQQVSGIIGLARKQAGASYQQRYLWVPMQSTGGLADGRTYVGQMDLELETALQLELGVDFTRDNISLSPRVFLHRIDDYIQGVPATDPRVVMAAAMMGDAQPLMFANTDARLLGMDLSGRYLLAQNWRLDMLASYVSGERRDIDDNLYRIAPPSATLGLSYLGESWFARLEGVAVDGQNKVSATSQEQTTPGYGLLNLSLGYDSDDWMLRAGVNNLLDRSYGDHLAGYNRVMNSQIAPGERMPGDGINAWLTGEYRF